jgi:hypothetical protein
MKAPCAVEALDGHAARRGWQPSRDRGIVMTLALLLMLAAVASLGGRLAPYEPIF